MYVMKVIEGFICKKYHEENLRNPVFDNILSVFNKTRRLPPLRGRGGGGSVNLGTGSLISIF